MIDKTQFITDLVSLAERKPPVRFLHQGRDPDVGLDCIGALRWAYMQQFEALPDQLERQFDAYLRRPNGHHLLNTMRQWFEEVEREAARQPGDLIVVYDRKNPQHVAVVLNDSDVFEMYSSPQAGINKALRQPFDKTRRVVAAVFRFPESGPKARKWQR